MVDRPKRHLAAMSNHTKGVVYGTLSALFVTAYVLVNKYVYNTYDVEPFSYAVTFAAAGGLIAAVALFTRHVARRDVAVSHKILPQLLVLGLAGATAMGLVVFGQNFTTAVNAGIILTASIVTTSIFSKYFLKESFSRKQWRWLAVMFVGLYLGVVGLHIVEFRPGDLIILGASVAFGFGNTFSKIVMRKLDRNLIADARLIISGLLMLIIGFVLVGSDVLVLSAGLWPLLAGLFFWLTIRTFFGAIHHTNPNSAIVLNNSQIFFTAVAGVLLLSEAYDWVKFVGSALVLISIYFISKK